MRYYCHCICAEKSYSLSMIIVTYMVSRVYSEGELPDAHTVVHTHAHTLAYTQARAHTQTQKRTQTQTQILRYRHRHRHRKSNTCEGRLRCTCRHVSRTCRDHETPVQGISTSTGTSTRTTTGTRSMEVVGTTCALHTSSTQVLLVEETQVEQQKRR